MVHPGIQFKSVEGNALIADRDFSQMWAHFAVETVAIHSHIQGRVPKPEQTWKDGCRNLCSHRHSVFLVSERKWVIRTQLV
jgi:hypothetical protein